MAHIGCKATSAATSRAHAARTPVAFGRAQMWKAERRGTDVKLRVSIAFVRSCPCAYKWGMETDICQTSTQVGNVSFRCPALTQNQQRCLTPRSSCAFWGSSLSPPPATSKTALEEGNGRCQRLGSDRFGHLSFVLILVKSSLFKKNHLGVLDWKFPKLPLREISQLKSLSFVMFLPSEW